MTGSRRATRSNVMSDDDQCDYKCLFITHLELESDKLDYTPDLSQFQKVLTNTMTRYQDCTLAVPNLLPDQLFNAFTRYMYIHVIRLTCNNVHVHTCMNI